MTHISVLVISWSVNEQKYHLCNQFCIDRMWWLNWRRRAGARLRRNQRRNSPTRSDRLTHQQGLIYFRYLNILVKLTFDQQGLIYFRYLNILVDQQGLIFWLTIALTNKVWYILDIWIFLSNWPLTNKVWYILDIWIFLLTNKVWYSDWPLHWPTRSDIFWIFEYSWPLTNKVLFSDWPLTTNKV